MRVGVVAYFAVGQIEVLKSPSQNLQSRVSRGVTAQTGR